jgi:hypothetical protein
VEQRLTSGWRRLWNKQRSSAILIACLLLPFVFIPLWIISLLVLRNKGPATLPEENTLADATTGEPKTAAEIALSAGGLTSYGLAVFVAAAACYLGFDVMDQARGPGGGIALLTAYTLVAGGIVGLIVSFSGLVRRIKALK